MSKKCLGCGINLQEENKEESGYTKTLDMDYCMRCFRITHYHDLDFVDANIEGKNIIKSLYNKKGFAFFFIDFLNISKESIAYYKEITMPKCLVISKSDMIPRSIYLPRITEWLRKIFEIEESVVFLTKNSKSSIKKIVEIMERQSIDSYYMAGMTNAGKSTFINELLNYTDNKKNVLTVSERPNTTLDFVKIKFLYGTIFDTAGIPYSYYKGDNEFLKKTNILGEIKPITFPLKENMSLLIEQKIRVEFSGNSSVTVFGSDNLDIIKVYEKNVYLKDLPVIELKLKGNQNVLIKGLCFFYLKQACNFKIYGVEKENIEVNPSFMGGFNE